MKKRCFSLLIVVCAIVLLDVQSASAFYWQNWPGSGTPTTPTTPTVVPTTPSTPTTPPVVDTGEPVDPNPPDDPDIVHAPEPATLVGGLIGLGVLAIARARRKSQPLAA